MATTKLHYPTISPHTINILMKCKGVIIITSYYSRHRYYCNSTLTKYSRVVDTQGPPSNDEMEIIDSLYNDPNTNGSFKVSITNYDVDTMYLSLYTHPLNLRAIIWLANKGSVLYIALLDKLRHSKDIMIPYIDKCLWIEFALMLINLMMTDINLMSIENLVTVAIEIN